MDGRRGVVGDDVVVVVAVEGEILNGEVVRAFDPSVGRIVGIRHAQGGQLLPGTAKRDVRRNYQLLADDKAAPRYQHDSPAALARLLQCRLDRIGVVLLIVPLRPKISHIYQRLVFLLSVQDRNVEWFAPSVLSAVPIVHKQLVATWSQLFRHRHRERERLCFF